MSYVGEDDIVMVKHTSTLARVTRVLTYEWNVEFLDGTTGRVERDDFIPVSTVALWALAGMAPGYAIGPLVRAAATLTGDDE